MTDSKEMFNDILDDGEEILGIMKPNKRKYWNFFNWMFFWSVIFIPIFGVIAAISSALDPEYKGLDVLWVVLITLGGCIVVCFVSYFIARYFARLAYKKRYYAYTNKRILIRCGIIGVDYKVLDYKLLGATTVSVGVLDRMLGAKTGYLRFGSASSPIVGVGSFARGAYTFSHVDMPYELLKEVKKIINVAQEDSKK